MKRTDGKAEILRYTRYYEQDGKLRAYANRAMLLTTLFAVVAIVLCIFNHRQSSMWTAVAMPQSLGVPQASILIRLLRLF